VEHKIPGLFIQREYLTDGTECRDHLVISLVTGSNPLPNWSCKGTKPGHYSVKYIAFGRLININWNKCYWWYDLEGKEPLPVAKLPLYLDLPSKAPLFEKILKGEYKRL